MWRGYEDDILHVPVAGIQVAYEQLQTSSQRRMQSGVMTPCRT
jgi:hypothetical protein